MAKMVELTEEQVLAKLAELKLELSPDIEYRYETLFAKLEGWGVAAYIRRRHKLHRHVEPLLRRMLREGEEVLFVGKGVYQSALEQYFMGALLANLVNQTLFVLTNLRLIMIHCNTKGVPGHTYWTIFYSQIKDFKASWTGSVVLKLNDGKKYSFAGFESLDRKQMPEIFKQALADYNELGFDPAVSQSRENMCSHCLTIVPAGEYRCQECGAEFWKPMDLALRSLLFPSWGDFLMRHTSAAYLELASYGFSWLVLGWLVVIGAQQGGEDFVIAIVTLCIVLGFEHVVDALITRFIAKKGLYLKQAPVT